jgi:hypothetical protein
MLNSHNLSTALNRATRTIVSQMDTLYALWIANDVDVLRQALLRAAQELSSLEIPAKGMERRWFVQRCRCILNRLIYLISPALLWQLIPPIDELVELRAVVAFLGDTSFRTILDFPGAGSRVAGEISFRQGSTIRLQAEELTVDPTSVRAEAILNLAAWGVVTNQGIDGWRDHRLLRSISPGLNTRLLADFSFEDEVESLLLGKRQEYMTKTLATQYSNRETVTVEALRLDGDYSG